MTFGTLRPLVLCGWVMLTLSASAQESQKSLASTLEVYAFPADGQSQEQQSRDEAACYQWAVSNVGADPFTAAKDVNAAQAEAARGQELAAQAGRGAGARGALGGAAAGAVIGQVADDEPGSGAAYGAAAGAVIARRRAARAEQQAAQEGQRQVEKTMAASEAQVDSFRKAFTVCLEAKQYLVRY
ncbi:MAG: hypothetical protein R3E86_03965 [Pseudomonadales bacterium]